jgi:hypothetical protein
MHDLQAERFYTAHLIKGMAAADGPIKTFPLRGILSKPSGLPAEAASHS